MIGLFVGHFKTYPFAVHSLTFPICFSGREETLTEHAMSWNERKLEHIAESIARKHMRVNKY